MTRARDAKEVMRVNKLVAARRVGGMAAMLLAGLSALPILAHAERDDRRAARPFEVVVDRVLDGDLVIAANSNLASAGGWDRTAAANADVDGDRSRLCVRRRDAEPVCSDNSSSATLDIPRKARIVAARLYVETALSANAGPLRVRLDGPRAPLRYTVLGTHTAGVPRMYEASAVVSSNAVMRQSVWDVTKYVAAKGPGRYTVADIVGERAGAYLPYASWAIVAAYELDPNFDLGDVSARERPRFAKRAVSWHDGFVRPSERTLEVPITELAIDPESAAFAKSLHIVAGARRGSADNLLINGQPLGNNDTPGDSPPPLGVTIGRRPSCNSTTDVFNETICVLGTPVVTKRPGPRAYLAARDGVTPSSGSAVDMDVVRIPDRYLVPGSDSMVFSATTATEPLAVGMLAISADLTGATS
jgi:hypothetical protein